jgi:type IV pilus assembly protein PilA
MFSLIQKRMKGGKGFTLIELLVVIIIIAILAAIAIPTFLGQRQKAQDTASKSLVRNAMTAIESSYVDNRVFDVAKMTADSLHAIEPSITFLLSGAIATPYSAAPAADTSANAVAFYGVGQTYSVGTMSASGTAWGVFVDKAGTGTAFYKGGAAATW